MRPVDPELYPFAEHFFELGDLRMHYVDEGGAAGGPNTEGPSTEGPNTEGPSTEGPNTEGPSTEGPSTEGPSTEGPSTEGPSTEGPSTKNPVVCVHGNPTWSFYWRNAILALEDQRRCIAIDHIGCGKSDKPGDDKYTYTLAQRVADLGALIDHLGLEKVDLMAHDWGGMIACAWAVAHPERVGRMVLMNTGAFPLPAGKKMPRSLWLARDTGLGAFLVRGCNAFSAGATRMAVSKPLPAAVRRGLTAPYDSWANRIATLRFVQDIPLKPTDAAWQVVAACEAAIEAGALADVPVLLLWGMRDFVFDHHFLDRFEALLPHAVTHRFEAASHYVLEDEKDAILPLLQDFFS